MEAILEELEKINERISKLNERLDKIEKSTDKMDHHIDFVHYTYTVLRTPLTLLTSMSNRIIGNQNKGEDHKLIEDKLTLPIIEPPTANKSTFF